MAPRRDQILRRKGREDVATPDARKDSSSSRILNWWLGLMALGGLAFGLSAERRPFGDDLFLHPLAVFYAAVAVALLALRVALRRPVPELIRDRMLLAGCMLGAVTFLAGNWIDTHLFAVRW